MIESKTNNKKYPCSTKDLVYREGISNFTFAISFLTRPLEVYRNPKINISNSTSSIVWNKKQYYISE